MKKKFLIIISSILCFIVLAFLITMRHSIPMLALGNVSIQENDTFSNDLLVDLDYYNTFDSDSVNLLPKDSYYAKDSENTKYNLYNLESKVYTLVDLSHNIGWLNFSIYNGNTKLYDLNWRDVGSHTFQIDLRRYTFTSVNLDLKNYLYDSIMLVEGSNVPASYVPYYKNMFGFSITSTNTSIISGLDYVEKINSDNYYYLPFNIASNGKISFNYTFPIGANITFNKIVIRNKINGVVNDKIKLQYSYSNFSLGYKSITFIDGVPSSGENWYGLIFQSDAPQVKIQSGKSSVYYANFKSEIYNYLYASDFIDHTDYLNYAQVLGFNSYASSSNEKRTISFESLVCSSFGSGGGIVITDNPDNEYEIYREVSGPFDFTTMIYNAFTWIIFNVPVIGPVLNVLRSVRVMFTSVVSIGQLFTGFGVIFSIFIVCLILHIIKHLNGGD